MDFWINEAVPFMDMFKTLEINNENLLFIEPPIENRQSLTLRKHIWVIPKLNV